MAKVKEENQETSTINSFIENLSKRLSTTVFIANSREITHHPAISTGSITLDHALGIGGVPIGRMIEIFGQESSGKTTLSLSLMVQAQKKFPNKLVAIIDAEHALDLGYAKSLGLDLSKLVISQPDTAEQCLDLMEDLVASNNFSMIVLDSVAALSPKAELEGDSGDSTMGVLPRLMNAHCRKIKSIASNTDTTLIYINQIREKIGVMFGNPQTTPGGNALKFFTSVRLQIRKLSEKQDSEADRSRSKVTVKKNKMAAPYREAEFDILFGKGIDNVGSVIDLASAHGILDKSGSWYSYNGERLGQGIEKVSAFLLSQPELYKELSDKVRALLIETDEEK